MCLSKVVAQHKLQEKASINISIDFASLWKKSFVLICSYSEAFIIVAFTKNSLGDSANNMHACKVTCQI